MRERKRKNGDIVLIFRYVLSKDETNNNTYNTTSNKIMNTYTFLNSPIDTREPGCDTERKFDQALDIKIQNSTTEQI